MGPHRTAHAATCQVAGRHTYTDMATACGTCQQQGAAWSLSHGQQPGWALNMCQLTATSRPGCPAHAITQAASRVSRKRRWVRGQGRVLCAAHPCSIGSARHNHGIQTRISFKRQESIRHATPRLHVANMPTDGRGLARLSPHPEVGAETSTPPPPPPKSPRVCSAALWLCQAAQATECSPMPRVNPAEPVVSLVRTTTAHMTSKAHTPSAVHSTHLLHHYLICKQRGITQKWCSQPVDQAGQGGAQACCKQRAPRKCMCAASRPTPGRRECRQRATTAPLEADMHTPHTHQSSAEQGHRDQPHRDKHTHAVPHESTPCKTAGGEPGLG